MKARALGELEQAVMEIIWDCGKCSVKDVVRELRKKKEIAYTTVATILQRLQAKGLLVKAKHLYSSKVTRSQYSRGLIKNFLKNLTNTFGDVALASFAESVEDLPKKQRARLLKLLKD